MTDQVTELEQTEDTLRFLPEAGQLVNVRRRQWIVADVDASTLSKERKSSSLVTLTVPLHRSMLRFEVIVLLLGFK